LDSTQGGLHTRRDAITRRDKSCGAHTNTKKHTRIHTHTHYPVDLFDKSWTYISTKKKLQQNFNENAKRRYGRSINFDCDINYTIKVLRLRRSCGCGCFIELKRYRIYILHVDIVADMCGSATSVRCSRWNKSLV